MEEYKRALSRQIDIMDNYISYLETELKDNGKSSIGTLDLEHLHFAMELRRELAMRKKNLVHANDPGYYKYPVTVQLELTFKCNQSCIQCYNQSGLEKNKEGADVPVEKWVEIAKDLAKLPVCQIIISGGEPTLLKGKLFEIMDIFHEVGIHFIFITNGMLINEENIKKFSKYNYAWMQFSIDGATEETHDYIRGAKSFKKVIKAASLARAEGIPVGIASVIVKKNFHEIKDLIDLAYHLGAYKHTCGEFMYSGRAVVNSKDLELTDREIKRIKKLIIKKRIQYRGLMDVTKPFDPALTLRFRMSTVSQGLLIRPDGEVRIDCQAPARIGNVMEGSILDIWNSIGNKAWGQPELLDYIDKVKNYKDLKIVEPRSHFDPDLDLALIRNNNI